MDYLNFETDDFVSDPSFRLWVENGGFSQKDSAWTIRLEQDSRQKLLAIKAREIILATRIEEHEVDQLYTESIVSTTLDKIQKLGKIKRLTINRLRFIPYAAAAIGILLIGVWFTKLNVVPDTKQTNAIASEAHEKLVTYSNATDKVVPIALSDGSTVLLQPHSQIDYPKNFTRDKREVWLEGEAFFEVVKNKEKPFLVYSHEMVTRVLGTSFTVKAFAEESNFEVKVRMGSVEVSANTMDEGNRAVGLLPNEQVVLDRAQKVLKKETVNPKDVQVIWPAPSQYTVFNDVPVAEIFEKLSHQYHITIDFDSELLANCSITSTLSDEPLFEKLGIICQAIGSSTQFVTKDNTITISSRGCNQ